MSVKSPRQPPTIPSSVDRGDGGEQFMSVKSPRLPWTALSVDGGDVRK